MGKIRVENRGDGVFSQIHWADLGVRVIKEDGELIRHFTLNPAKNYQPRKDD
jgi:hypothetical protein